MAWNPGYQCGKYTIDKTLGEGGFCITYQAHDSKGQKFALKTLNDDVQKRHDFDKHQQDFVNESLKIKQFDHPHIVKVYELIQQGRLWCVVMEYIDGGDLANYVVNNGLLSEQKALRYIQQIGDALHLVHQKGLLHRDIKPQNIMLRKATDEAVLIDFGIAREFEQNVTKTHTQYLTEGFAPVEQYNNVSKRGAYTDIYALAATLYCLLTASVPAPALDRQASIGQHRRDILQPPKTINPNISDKVNSAILKGLNVEPKPPRPQYMIDWLRMLGLELIVPPPPPPLILTPVTKPIRPGPIVTKPIRPGPGRRNTLSRWFNTLSNGLALLGAMVFIVFQFGAIALIFVSLPFVWWWGCPAGPVWDLWSGGWWCKMYFIGWVLLCGFGVILVLAGLREWLSSLLRR